DPAVTPTPSPVTTGGSGSASDIRGGEDDIRGARGPGCRPPTWEGHRSGQLGRGERGRRVLRPDPAVPAPLRRPRERTHRQGRLPGLSMARVQVRREDGADGPRTAGDLPEDPGPRPVLHRIDPRAPPRPWPCDRERW